MIVLWLVLVMFVAGYQIWRADHIRLIPKLELSDCRVISTPTNDPEEQRVYGQILVKCSSDAPLNNCRGQILRVMRWSGNEWIPTVVDESLDLLWSTIDRPSRTIEPGADQQLCLFFVSNLHQWISPWVETIQLRMREMFQQANPADIFRFDIQVTAAECPPKRKSIRIQMGQQWNAPLVEPIDGA